MNVSGAVDSGRELQAGNRIPLWPEHGPLGFAIARQPRRSIVGCARNSSFSAWSKW